jgi:hypothetical protein
LGIPFSGPCPGSRFLHKLYGKAVEESAATAGSASYSLYFSAYELHHHGAGDTLGLRMLERVGIHGDMYFDRIEHAHGDSRTQYDEHVYDAHYAWFKVTLWFRLPGAHGRPGHRVIDY